MDLKVVQGNRLLDVDGWRQGRGDVEGKICSRMSSACWVWWSVGAVGDG